MGFPFNVDIADKFYPRPSHTCTYGSSLHGTRKALSQPVAGTADANGLCFGYMTPFLVRS